MSFLNLWKGATPVLTGSGGLQEETTALGVPCITMRDGTERLVTVDEGIKHLAGTDPARIVALDILGKGGNVGRQPHLQDGTRTGASWMCRWHNWTRVAKRNARSQDASHL